MNCKTFYGATPGNLTCGIMPIWTQRNVLCPLLIHAYSQHIGGADPSVKLMLVHIYKISSRSRWWELGYIFALYISLTDCWLVCETDCVPLNKKQMSSKVLLTLDHNLKQINIPVSKAERPSSSSQPRAASEGAVHPKSLTTTTLQCERLKLCYLCWKYMFFGLNAHQQCFDYSKKVIITQKYFLKSNPVCYLIKESNLLK